LKVTLNSHDDIAELAKKGANGKDPRRILEDR